LLLCWPCVICSLSLLADLSPIQSPASTFELHATLRSYQEQHLGVAKADTPGHPTLFPVLTAKDISKAEQNIGDFQRIRQAGTE
jgi:hypothetical protein